MGVKGNWRKKWRKHRKDGKRCYRRKRVNVKNLAGRHNWAIRQVQVQDALLKIATGFVEEGQRAIQKAVERDPPWK